MSERRVTCAKDAVKIIREYAQASCRVLFWRDVLECKYDEEADEWRVIYEASPSLTAPYYRYEAIINARTGEVKEVKRLTKT